MNSKVLAWATGAPAPKAARPSAPAPRQVTGPHGEPLAKVKRTDSALTLTIPARNTDGFDAWLDAHAEELLQDLHARWLNERAED